MSAGVLSAAAGSRTLFWAALPVFAALAVMGVAGFRVAPPQLFSHLYWLLSGATVALWTTLSLTALWHAPADRRVRLFALTAVVISLTVVLPGIDPAWPGWLVAAGLAAYSLAYFGSMPVVVHMASEIPGVNPFVARHPRFIQTQYVVGALLAAGAAGAWYLIVFGDLDPARATALSRSVVVANRAFYVYTGVAAMGLLAVAARHDALAYRRRQAFVVIIALALWTANSAAMLLVPGLESNAVAVNVVEPLAVLAPPLAIALAAFRFHLFDIGSALRRLLLLEPVARRIVATVDRGFFPEKVVLRRLRRTLLADLASETTIDGMGRRLTERLVSGLGASSAALLIVDDAREVFRVRAAAGALADDRAARDALVAAGGAVPDALPRDTVVRVDFRGEPLALICIGPLASGARLDDDDRDALAHVAQQLAAMIENARLFELARIDSLTGLARRDVFDGRLREEMTRSARTGRPYAVAMADVDHFKRINDQYGHRAGDRVLQEIARVLTEQSRALDVVARYGGEEFVILLPETGRAAAALAAEKLRAAVENAPVAVNGARLRVTVSIGVAASAGGDAGEDLVARADAALYLAKRGGRNQVR